MFKKQNQHDFTLEALESRVLYSGTPVEIEENIPAIIVDYQKQEKAPNDNATETDPALEAHDHEHEDSDHHHDDEHEHNHEGEFETPKALEAGVGGAVLNQYDGQGSTLRAAASIPGFEHTTGHKDVLWVRLRTADQTSPNTSEADIKNIFNNLNEEFYAESYGKTSLSVTVSDVYTLSNKTEHYQNLDEPDSRQRTNARFSADADQALIDNGIKASDYDRIIFESEGFYFGGGLAQVGGTKIWFRQGAESVLDHELGHTYGFSHSNYYETANESALESGGSNVEYGNVLDIMGSADFTFNHLNKEQAGWINEGEEFQTLTASGTYRLFSLESNQEGVLQSLKLKRDTNDLSIAYRSEFRHREDPYSFNTVENQWFDNGLYIVQEQGSRGTQLVDLTPDSKSDKTNFFGQNEDVLDAALLIGKTLHLPSEGIFITPTRVIPASGNTPASIEVFVHFGVDSNNQAPTASLTASSNAVTTNTQVNFSATASDANADSLAYLWMINGEEIVHDNTSTLNYSFSTAGIYQVEVLVSDMKGGYVSKTQTITVDSPVAARVLSGTAQTAGGKAITGVKITANTADENYVTYTDENGQYSFNYLDSSKTYSVEADFDGYKITAEHTNITADSNALNFTVTEPTLITINNGSGGQALPGAGFLLHPDEMATTVSITPERNYFIDSVTVNGDSQTLPTDRSNTYDLKLTNVTSAQNISIQYRQITFGDNILLNPSFDATTPKYFGPTPSPTPSHWTQGTQEVVRSTAPEDYTGATINHDGNYLDTRHFGSATTISQEVNLLDIHSAANLNARTITVQYGMDLFDETNPYWQGKADIIVTEIDANGNTVNTHATRGIDLSNTAFNTESASFTLDKSTRSLKLTYSSTANGVLIDNAFLKLLPAPGLAPIADNDSASVDEGASVNINIADGDTDADGTIDLSSISIQTQPKNGKLTIQNDGTVDYKHNGSETLSDSFTYTIKDNDGDLSSIATVNITVKPVNDNTPTLTASTLTLDEGQTITVTSAMLNATDADTATANSDLKFTVSEVKQGDFKLKGGKATQFTLADIIAGDVTFTHDGSETAPSFKVLISDATNATTASNANVSFTHLNDAPVITAINTQPTNEDAGTYSFDLKSTASDAEGTTLTFSTLQQTAGTKITANLSNGVLSFDTNQFNALAANASETLTFTVDVSDGDKSVTQTISIKVDGRNDVPTVSNETFSTNKDTVADFDVLANDSDADTGANLTIASATLVGSNGQVSIVGDKIRFNPNGNFASLLPAQSQAVTVNYTVEDGNGGSVAGVLTVNVTGLNTAPVASDDSATLNEGASITINLAANDSDIDANLDASSVLITSATKNGTVVNNNDGTVTYSHNGGEDRGETFTYTIKDSLSATSNTGTVTVNVTPVNDRPTSSGLITQTLQEDFRTYSIDLRSIFEDAETSDANLIYSVSGNSIVAVQIVNGIANISSTLNANGRETLTFKAEDADGASITSSTDFIVAAVNDEPRSSKLSNQNLTEDFADYSIDLKAYFEDIETSDTKLIYTVSGNTNIGVSINNGIANISAATANWNGRETLTFKAEDQGGKSITTSADFLVTAVNDAASIGADTAKTDNKTAVTVDVLANDSDVDGDKLSIANLSTASGKGLVTIVDGKISFDPNGDYNFLTTKTTVNETINYQVLENGATPSHASLVISITGFNSAPVAQNDQFSIDEDEALIASLFSNNGHGQDGDFIDGDNISVTLVNASSSNVGKQITLASGAKLNVNSDGSFSYDPNGAFNQLTPRATSSDSFTYQITDALGLTSSASVSITIHGVNTPASVSGDLNFSVDLSLSSFTTGSITSFDADNLNGFQSGRILGLYGNLNIDAKGNYSFIAADSTKLLKANSVFNETFIVKTKDGSEVSLNLSLSRSVSTPLINLETRARDASPASRTNFDKSRLVEFVAELKSPDFFNFITSRANASFDITVNSDLLRTIERNLPLNSALNNEVAENGESFEFEQDFYNLNRLTPGQLDFIKNLLIDLDEKPKADESTDEKETELQSLDSILPTFDSMLEPKVDETVEPQVLLAVTMDELDERRSFEEIMDVRFSTFAY